MVSRKSKIDFHCALSGSFQVSKNGDDLIAARITSDFKWEIVKENLNFGQILFLPRIQTHVINNFLLYEEKNIVMSGCDGGKICIFDWKNGDLLHEINLEINSIYSSFLFGRLAVVGGKQNVAFVDLISGKRIHKNTVISSECKSIWSIKIGNGDFEIEGENVEKPILVMAGFGNVTITRVPLSRKFKKFADIVLNEKSYIFF